MKHPLLRKLCRNNSQRLEFRYYTFFKYAGISIIPTTYTCTFHSNQHDSNWLFKLSKFYCISICKTCCTFYITLYLLLALFKLPICGSQKFLKFNAGNTIRYCKQNVHCVQFCRLGSSRDQVSYSSFYSIQYHIYFLTVLFTKVDAIKVGTYIDIRQ